MASIVYTITAANVAAGLVSINAINSLISNGNPGLLTANQNTAMANIQALFIANPAGMINYTFTDAVLGDVTTFAAAVNNLANNGPTLTFSQNQAAAGSIIPIPTGGANGFPVGANTVVFNDGYFIAEAPGTNAFQVSTLNNGLVWPLLAQGTAESNPNNIRALEILNGQLVVFGQQTIQYFQDNGPAAIGAALGQPYDPIVGATQQVGLAAIYSTAQFMGTVVFLGQKFNGPAQVFMIQGYTPVPISNSDIENLINSFLHIDLAMAFSYVVDGHDMYELTFPLDGYSFLYDGLTQIWSTVQTGVQEGGRHNIQFGTTFNQNNMVTDYISGNVYYLTTNTQLDNGQPIKRRVVTRHVYNDGNRFSIPQLILDMDTGEGLQSGQGSDPKIMIACSKDNGRTYSNERMVSIGKVGQYRKRVATRRWGSSRDFVFKITMTDPVPFIITSGSAVIVPGTESGQ